MPDQKLDSAVTRRVTLAMTESFVGMAVGRELAYSFLVLTVSSAS